MISIDHYMPDSLQN